MTAEQNMNWNLDITSRNMNIPSTLSAAPFLTLKETNFIAILLSPAILKTIGKSRLNTLSFQKRDLPLQKQ